MVKSAAEMQAFGVQIGALLTGGEVIELIGDIGAGKTTLTKGIAYGMGISDDIQSPTFTISRVYDAPSGLVLAHYDFYRLTDAGIMVAELHDSVTSPHTVTVLEWAGIVRGVVPKTALTLQITSPTETTRTITLQGQGEVVRRLFKGLE